MITDQSEDIKQQLSNYSCTFEGVPEATNGVNWTQIEDSLPVSASNCITVDQTTKLYDSP